MQPARRQALALASATLRRASGTGTSTSSTSGSRSNGSGGGLFFSFDRSELSNPSLLARGFASRRPKVSVLLKEVRDTRYNMLPVFELSRWGAGISQCAPRFCCRRRPICLFFFFADPPPRPRHPAPFPFCSSAPVLTLSPLSLPSLQNNQPPKKIQDVEGLGEAGTEASVRPGYARNALLPRGAAELVPHRRARRGDRPPRSVLQERLSSEEEARKGSSMEAAAAAAAAAAAPAEGGGAGRGSDQGGTSPARLVAVARSLSRGALEFVRPLGPEGSGGSGKDEADSPSSSSSSSSFAPSSSGSKIAEPIDAGAFALAVASQKRIALDPRLVILDRPIDEQGEHFVPLRMRLGGERVVVRALVGLAAAAASGGGGDEKKGGGGGRKRGGKR